MLRVDIAEVGDVAVCHVAGDLGRTTASRFTHAFTGWLGRPRLVINRSELRFLDGAGLTALVGGIWRSRELSAEVVTSCGRCPLRKVLECVGLSLMVRVSDRTEDALRRSAQQPP
jgi:anti-anti-sigma factor